MKQKDIASLTGLNQSEVSRAMKWLREINVKVPPSVQKVLKAMGRKVVVVDCE